MLQNRHAKIQQFIITNKQCDRQKKTPRWGKGLMGCRAWKQKFVNKINMLFCCLFFLSWGSNLTERKKKHGWLIKMILTKCKDDTNPWTSLIHNFPFCSSRLFLSFSVWWLKSVQHHKEQTRVALWICLQLYNKMNHLCFCVQADAKLMTWFGENSRQ